MYKYIQIMGNIFSGTVDSTYDNIKLKCDICNTNPHYLAYVFATEWRRICEKFTVIDKTNYRQFGNSIKGCTYILAHIIGYNELSNLYDAHIIQKWKNKAITVNDLEIITLYLQQINRGV